MRCEVVCTAICGHFRETSHCGEAVVERNAKRARNVVVARSCGAQPVWCVRHEGSARATSDNAQGLERGCDFGAFEAVVAMFALGEHPHQSVLLQQLQVHAGRGRGNFCHERKFGTRSGTAIGEAVEHARPGRLANG